MPRSWLTISLSQSIADWINNVRFRKYDFIPIDDNNALLSIYHGKSRRVTIPSWLRDYNIEEIGNAVFNNNSRIRSITIQNGITTIDHEAFEDCINLRQITIPPSVRDIHKQPFAGCIKLRSIRLNRGNTALYLQDGMLINRADGRLVFCINRNCSKLDVPEGVKIISSYAFGNCRQLRAINLPDTLERIDSCAFSCSGLNRIRIPAGTSKFDWFSLDFGLATQEIEVFSGSPADLFLSEKKYYVRADELGDGWVAYHRKNRP